MNDEAMRAEADKIINGKYMGDYDEFDNTHDDLMDIKSKLLTEMKEMTKLLKKRKKIKQKRGLVNYFTDQKERFERNVYMYERELLFFNERFTTFEGVVARDLLFDVKDMIKIIKKIRERHELLISGYTRLTT